MQVITIETPSLGDRSYIAHDGTDAIVVDPQRDVDRVLDAVEAAGLRITHIAETHVHNDYVTGGLALSRMTSATYVHAANERLPFDHHGVDDGDSFMVGTLTVQVLHTPGHTPHHLSYVARDGDGPAALFTGGSLLYGTVGRTDLISQDRTDELTRAQFRSARRLAHSLPDDTEVYPTHGFGSFCASAKSDSESDGTLGTERATNLALTIDDEDAFVERLVAGLTAFPRYYAHMGPLNHSGPVPVDLSPPAAVDNAELGRRLHRGEWVVDLRQRQLFAADHLAGAVGIELADPFSTYLGWLIPWGMPVTLIGDTPDQVAEAQRQLVRIGIDRPAGASAGGLEAWGPTGEHRSYRTVDFTDVAAASGEQLTVLDVRRHDERTDGYINGSLHMALNELSDRMGDLPAGPLWVHCASGFRASIAASLLDRGGFEVVLIDDDFAHAAEAGLEHVGSA